MANCLFIFASLNFFFAFFASGTDNRKKFEKFETEYESKIEMNEWNARNGDQRKNQFVSHLLQSVTVSLVEFNQRRGWHGKVDLFFLNSFESSQIKTTKKKYEIRKEKEKDGKRDGQLRVLSKILWECAMQPRGSSAFILNEIQIEIFYCSICSFYSSWNY